MIIAVIGGKGFIGRAFVGFAAERGHETVVIGSDYDAFSEEGSWDIKEILKNCDAMVFLAARRPLGDFSMQDYLYNVSLAEHYMRFADEVRIKNVVITSSRSVYSSNDIPWKENDFQPPLSLYGASKQAVDALALWYNENKKMKIKDLRLAQVLGMEEKKGFLLNTLIDNALAGNKQIIFGKGIGRRQYIYITDVCEAILHCLVSGKDASGIYNIGMIGNVSIIELAEIVNDVFGNRAGLEMQKDKPEDTKQYLMDISKAERELHWKPAYDLRAALMDIKEHV